MRKPSETPISVVAALVWKDGRLLICQRKETDAFPGKWEFPGGKVEPEESPAAALVRELLEELGIRARLGKQVAEIDHRYQGRRPVHLLFFAVKEFDGLPENRVFQQILWVEPPELSRFDFLDADRPLIERIASGELSSTSS